MGTRRRRYLQQGGTGVPVRGDQHIARADASGGRRDLESVALAPDADDGISGKNPRAGFLDPRQKAQVQLARVYQPLVGDHTTPAKEIGSDLPVLVSLRHHAVLIAEVAMRPRVASHRL